MLSLKQFSILSYFSLLFSLGIAQSQPYQPQAFSNIEPDWIHSSYDPSAADSADLSGYDHYFTQRLARDYESIVVDSFIYVATNHFLNYTEVVGFQVEKLNLNTGETIWQRVFDLRSSDHPEFIMRLEYLEDRNELVVLSAKRIQPWDNEDFNFFDFALFGAFSKIYDRRLDAKDGNILRQLNPMVNNDEFPTMENDSRNEHVIRSQADNPDDLWLWDYQRDNFKFIKYDIDRSGIKQDSLIHDISFPGIDVDSTFFLSLANPVMQWQEDNHLATLQVLINRVQTSPSEIESAKIVVCDENMNAVESIDLNSFRGYFNLGLLYMDQRIIYLFSQQTRSSISTQHFILDRQSGVIIHEFTRRIDPRNIQWLEDRDQYLCLEENGANASWDLFFLSLDGEIEFLKTIQLEGDYYSAPIEMKVLQDSSLFLRMSQGEFDGSLKVEWASTFMRLPADQINLVTSNDERIGDFVEVNIFPNPAQDYLQVRIDGVSNQKCWLRIYDVLGNKQYQGDILNKHSRIPVSDWKNGAYFYQVYQKSQVIKSGYLQIF